MTYGTQTDKLLEYYDVIDGMRGSPCACGERIIGVLDPQLTKVGEDTVHENVEHRWTRDRQSFTKCCLLRCDVCGRVERGSISFELPLEPVDKPERNKQ